ncbi:spore coat associated protein CotJA [Desulforamulus ruminis]|uniref:Spore coat associated protein JA (CotJA) n=1 Tax=Desulforamulus ruminis (strain ATCC 23193 / DSM 2154 / NCIMB 8452 / DL) TaxID=696281 RepID=F6DTZ2_DESRL|nr:spore coat associated protein CotJA [Desulforamulus ruminis]AEG59010.1 hypothetical protein Desru_0727 [Desulforamulus ruminis DSM 2154]
MFTRDKHQEQPLQAVPLMGPAPGKQGMMPPGMPGPFVQPMPGMGPGCYPGMQPGLELARAYVPIQQFGAVFNCSEALKRGTLFPDLYRPCPY